MRRGSRPRATRTRECTWKACHVTPRIGVKRLAAGSFSLTPFGATVRTISSSSLAIGSPFTSRATPGEKRTTLT